MAEKIEEGAGSITDVVLMPVSKIKPHPFQSLIPPQTPGEYAAMKADIAQRGIQEPLTITPGGVLLCGNHRFRAAKELDLAEVEVKIMTGLSPEQEIIHLVQDNIQRRHLKPAQRAAIVTHPKIAPALAALQEAARQRQVQGGKLGGKKAGRGRGKDRLEESVPQAKGKERQPQSRDLIGRLASVSGKLVDDAHLVWTKAPDRMDPILKGDPKPTLSGLARELRGKRPRPPLADSRRIAPPPSVTEDGQYEAALLCIIRLSANALGFIWTIESGVCRDAVLLQRVPDSRDDEGLVGRASPLGKVIAAIIPWPAAPAIDLAALDGNPCLLDVCFVRGKPKISIVGAEGDDSLPAGEEQGGALPTMDESPEESATDVEQTASVAPLTLARSTPEASSPRREPLWPGSDDEEPRVQEEPSSIDADRQDNRRCRACGDLLGDAPCEFCIECEKEIVGEPEK